MTSFGSNFVLPLINQGWDKVVARFYCLIQESHQRSDANHITQDDLIQIGRSFPIFDGVSGIFDRLHQTVKQLNPNTELEFYYITGGIGEIARNTLLSPYFTKIWGCEFHYNDRREIEFLTLFCHSCQRIAETTFFCTAMTCIREEV